MNREAADSVNQRGLGGETVEDRQLHEELKKDARKAHYEFGNSALTYVSHAGSHMVEHALPKDRGSTLEAQKAKMQKANFALQVVPETGRPGTTYAHCMAAPADSSKYS